MPASDLTIAQTITQIREALRDYVEATYHISHPDLVAQRRLLLEREGVLFRAPYIESTPRYKTSRRFADLDIPAAAKSLFLAMANQEAGQAQLLHDPPYTHQATALEAATRDWTSLVITTGTGSGKTESFLLPILARLAMEAQASPESFRTPALRAILLYPMNALVNDQLGRLRLLFGDPRVTGQFTAWADRPARFARYTSRTLYPGVRSVAKDQVRLKPIERFYVSLLEQATDPGSARHDRARALVASLQSKGKWPAIPELLDWYGASGSRWRRDGQFVRAVLRPEDSELFTRHEVLGNPPDLLITNYSMLEYMLMRPLERPIFDATRQWLADNPRERLLLVVDEAHMYRGAAGAEVGLLLRRLRARLAIPAERLQVICAGASFSDLAYAREFAAQLAGKAPADFHPIPGELALRQGAATGSEADARALAAVPLDEFYQANSDNGRTEAIRDFLSYRRAGAGVGDAGSALYAALHDFPPMSLLVNLTMKEAAPLGELGRRIFETEDLELAERATATLLALGSAARRLQTEPGLLPCRVHAFFRGLPGLWTCIDPRCSARVPQHPGSPAGALYAQPRATCACGARVFELFTCRNCGSAYARAYADDLEEPDFLWHEPGAAFLSATGQVGELHALDLLLEAPNEPAEPADLDVMTGRLNPVEMGERMRQVCLPVDRSGAVAGDGDEEPGTAEADGKFKPCAVCGQTAGYGRSSVQDHQTKGDQPFQALVTRQIEVQPPGNQPYSDFAPLRGRKVLAFSDSRQTAARLAPNLQTYSMRDVLRPLILRGWRELENTGLLAPSLSLEQLYLAVLIASHRLSVRLRPELKGTESMQAMSEVYAALDRGALHDPAQLFQLLQEGSAPPPQSLLRGMVATITDRYYGVRSLALASLRERRNLEPRIVALPPVPGAAETEPEKLALARLWLAQWAGPTAGIWFQHMNPGWWQTPRGVRPHSGKFRPMERWITGREGKKVFEREWLQALAGVFCEQVAPGKYRIRAANMALDLSPDWGYCQACRTTQRPYPGSVRCVNCGRAQVTGIDPDTDPVFTARKSYYRSSSVRALRDPPEPPMSIVAAEHTAQLNAAQSDEVFSKAEEHELLFQDVDLDLGAPGEQPRTAIDVLSCTTTMEVGIDIGTLSGVALRNMPPSRASYQQRSGRAGRRGNVVATVVAFGSADSHDEHYFTEPDAMIRGAVSDPVLALDNTEIARRHITAFLFQRYHQARLPEIEPEDQPQLFEVLGTVQDFLSRTSPLNRDDFEQWLRENEAQLIREVRDWLPAELAAGERDSLLAALVNDTLAVVDAALGEASENEQASADTGEDDATITDAPAEEGEEQGTPRRAAANLLDRLLYKGVLPRYAFPTDVVSFYVFDRERSTPLRPEYRYAPSQGLPIALTQYAPGKEVWIDGKLWKSGALFSPISQDRSRAWAERRLYFECPVCHYARTETAAEAERGERRDCPACGSEGTFGPARNWIRPPGFAHPQSREEGTSLDDQPARSYATRAKLVAGGPPEAARWTSVTPRIRQYYSRKPLLVTNTGPRREGYTYCTRCGLIEPTSIPTGTISGTHPKPYPDPREPDCPGSRSTRGLVLGTDFISDVLLVSLQVDTPLTIRPGLLATEVALRTLSEAITIAATTRLEIDPEELQAEYRPALTPGGREGLEAEIYLYDTLAGGAGFARRVGEISQHVFQDAIDLLEGCPDNCDRSCYRCLRSFKNRFEHDLLDRHLGASLLRYLVRGEEPVLDKATVEHAVDLLYEDLRRQGLSGVDLHRNARIDVPGIGPVEAPILAHSGPREFIIGIHGPLTPDHATDEKLREAKEYGSSVPVILIDEIVVSRNLPRASSRVIEEIK